MRLAGSLTGADEGAIPVRGRGAGRWIFDISTKNPGANATYVYRITLKDGSTVQFRYGLK